ncbi:hypothetical protein [Lactobacillus sp. PSON]|uniref:hypothetical protein n=1 Tax=Lactobacillus sp. PSON TaxID=3455454 RepID=UPI00404307B4
MKIEIPNFKFIKNSWNFNHLQDGIVLYDEIQEIIKIYHAHDYSDAYRRLRNEQESVLNELYNVEPLLKGYGKKPYITWNEWKTWPSYKKIEALRRIRNLNYPNKVLDFMTYTRYWGNDATHGHRFEKLTKNKQKEMVLLGLNHFHDVLTYLTNIYDHQTNPYTTDEMRIIPHEGKDYEFRLSRKKNKNPEIKTNLESKPIPSSNKQNYILICLVIIIILLVLIFIFKL